MNKREFVQKVIICMADTTAALQFIQDSGKYVDKIKHGLTDAEYLERMNKVKTAFNVNAVSLTCSEKIIMDNPIVRFFYRRLVQRTIMAITKFSEQAEVEKKLSEKNSVN